MEEGDNKYKTLLVIVTGLAVLGIPAKHHWFIYIAVSVGVISLIFPIVATWVVKGWYKLAEGLGWVNSRVLLSIIFYVFLYPISIFAKLSKSDSLNLKKTSAPNNSYYEERDHLYTKSDMEDVW